MAPFVSRGNQMAIASEDAVLYIDAATGITRHVPIPPLKADTTKTEPEKTEGDAKKAASEIAKNGNSNPDDGSNISLGTCLAFSSDASYLAVCTAQKNLVVWETSTLKMVKQWRASRKVSSLTFNSDNTQLFVADKAGDCYVYHLNEDTEKGKLILGHLSMLLDVVIAADDKFVITCERDEKIRVSFLPNAYNINNFCLGHTEFVSSLALVNSDLLLSGSGDATLKLWEYKTGKVLHTEKLRMPSDDDMQKAVRSITLFKVNAEFFIAAVVLNKSKSVLMYKINIKDIKFEYQALPFTSQPLQAVFTEDGSVYVLTDDPANPIEFFIKDGSFTYTLGESAIVSALLINAAQLKIVQDCIQSCNGDMKPLYKRWFDNVQAFRERKQNFKQKTTEVSETSNSKRSRVETSE